MTFHINKQNIIESSATVAINSLAQKKISSGIKIFNLSVGEPKLPMHELLLEAAVEAMRKGKTLYPPVSGISELKRSASEWMKNSYDCSYKPENCLVVNGGKFGIYLLLQLALTKGNEVIIVSPYWVSYPAITRLFGGTPIIVETNEIENWKLTPDKLKKVCSSNSKVLILNNGSNPTGILYTKQELKEILDVAREYNLLVISDEVYSGLAYDNHPYISCGSFPEHQDNVIVIQSCSKNFAMTGWRVGFVFGNENIIKQLTSLVGQSTSGVTTISQWVAVAAIENEKIINPWVKQEMQKRRDLMASLLNNQFSVTVNPPPSSLYFFISLVKLGVKNMTSAEFCTRVLEKENTALVPGLAFGKEGYIRLSFGTDEDDLIQGIKNLARSIHP